MAQTNSSNNNNNKQEEENAADAELSVDFDHMDADAAEDVGAHAPAHHVDLKSLGIATLITKPWGCPLCCLLVLAAIGGLAAYVVFNPVCLSFNFADFKVLNSDISNQNYQRSFAERTRYSNLNVSDGSRRRRRLSALDEDFFLEHSDPQQQQQQQQRRLQTGDDTYYGYRLWEHLDWYWRAKADVYLNVFFYSKNTTDDNILQPELLTLCHTIERGIKTFDGYEEHSVLFRAESPLDAVFADHFGIGDDSVYIAAIPGSFLNYVFPQVVEGNFFFDGNGESLFLVDGSIETTVRTYRDYGDLTQFFDFGFDFINVSSKYLAAVYPLSYRNETESKEQLLAWVGSYVDDYFARLPANLTDQVGVAVSDSRGEILNNELNFYLAADLLLAVWSLLVIYVVVYLYVRSLFITTFGLLGVILAFVPCFAIYHMVWGPSFNLVNMVAVWVILGIGCDDICVFISSYRRAPLESVDGQVIPNKLRLAFAYREGGSAMFVTSFTTACSFFSLCLSSINPLPQFGFFLGSLVLANYVIVMTWFPCVLQAYIWFVWLTMKCCPDCCRCCDRYLAVPVPLPQSYADDATGKLDKRDSVKVLARNSSLSAGGLLGGVGAGAAGAGLSRRVSSKYVGGGAGGPSLNGNGRATSTGKLVRQLTQKLDKKHEFAAEESEFGGCTHLYFVAMRRGLGIALIVIVLVLTCLFAYTATLITLPEETAKLLPDHTNWGQVNLAVQQMDIDVAQFSGYQDDTRQSTGATQVAGTPSPTEAPRPTVSPTETTASPTSAPTVNPTEATSAPTTEAPTAPITLSPSAAPTTAVPSATPTSAAPTSAPVDAPTFAPTDVPTSTPTSATSDPTTSPSGSPTTAAPTTRTPTAPTATTAPPTGATASPTKIPTSPPSTADPTGAPTTIPTQMPTPSTSNPSVMPTNLPTQTPSSPPTSPPTTDTPTTVSPTSQPTTSAPSQPPTTADPTAAPTTSVPTKSPSFQPTVMPTMSPTYTPPAGASYECFNEDSLAQEVSIGGGSIQCILYSLTDEFSVPTQLQYNRIALLLEGGGVTGSQRVTGCAAFDAESAHFNASAYTPSAAALNASAETTWCFAFDGVTKLADSGVSTLTFDVSAPYALPSPAWLRVSLWLFYDGAWTQMPNEDGEAWYNYSYVETYSPQQQVLSVDESVTVYLVFGTQRVSDFETDCDGNILDGDITFDSRFNLYSGVAQQRWLDLCDALSQLDDDVMYRRDDAQAKCMPHYFNEFVNSTSGAGAEMPNADTVNQTRFNAYLSGYVERSSSTAFSALSYSPAEFSTWFGTGSLDTWFHHNASVRWVYQKCHTQMNAKWGGAALWEYYLKWQAFIDDFNAASPPSFQGMQTASDYIRMEVEVAFLTGFVQSVSYTVVLCALVMVFFTQNLYLVCLVCLYIVVICVWVVGLFGAVGWPFGIIEIISVPTVVGLSIDYALHITHAYIHSPFPDRLRRSKSAVNDLGSSVLASAMTTILSMLILYFATIVIFSDLGWVVGSTTAFGVALALFVCPPLLMYTGPQFDQCHCMWLLCCCPKHVNGLTFFCCTCCTNEWRGVDHNKYQLAMAAQQSKHVHKKEEEVVELELQAQPPPPQGAPPAQEGTGNTSAAVAATVAAVREDSAEEEEEEEELPLPPGWKAVLTDDGKLYYQNESTKQTQWYRPDDAEDAAIEVSRTLSVAESAAEVVVVAVVAASAPDEADTAEVASEAASAAAVGNVGDEEEEGDNDDDEAEPMMAENANADQNDAGDEKEAEQDAFFIPTMEATDHAAQFNGAAAADASTPLVTAGDGNGARGDYGDVDAILNGDDDDQDVIGDINQTQTGENDDDDDMGNGQASAELETSISLSFNEE